MRRKDAGWLSESSETSHRKGQRDRKGREVRPKEEAKLNAFLPGRTQRKFWKNNAIYKDAKGRRIII